MYKNLIVNTYSDPTQDITTSIYNVSIDTYKLETRVNNGFINGHFDIESQRLILKDMKEKMAKELVEHLFKDNFIQCRIEENPNMYGKDVRLFLYAYKPEKNDNPNVIDVLNNPLLLK